MYVDLLTLLISLAVLIYAADAFIDAVVLFAERMRIPPMVVGLTIVAIGTSLPELMASGAAAIKGYPEIALGNVIGSNVCNVGLILGLPALFTVITCSRAVVVREGMVMLFVTALLWGITAASGGLSRTTGFVFVVGFFAFIGWVFLKSSLERRRENETDNSDEDTDSAEKTHEDAQKIRGLMVKMLAALAALLISSEFLVRATVGLAQAWGVSEGVIAISVIALGTSLPELSVSIAAAKRNQGDILVGNILGSNISNILLVLGISSMITPFQVRPITLSLDFPMVALLSILMVWFLYRKEGIDLKRGVLLLVLYALVIVRCVMIPF